MSSIQMMKFPILTLKIVCKFRFHMFCSRSPSFFFSSIFIEFFLSYYGYRENDGSYSEQHWYVIITKIVFVIVFQNVVTAINSFLKVVIPDEPGSLRLRKRQHAFITNELIIRHELQSHQQNFQEPNLN